MRISLYFLLSEPELGSRGTGVGYKIPPRSKLVKDRSFRALPAPDLVCGTSPNSLGCPDFFDNELLHSSIGSPQRPSGPHVSRPSTATDYPRTSFGLRQHPNFSDNEISIVTRLLSSFYGGRPPFGSRSSSYESQTSTTNGLLRTPTAGCLS